MPAWRRSLLATTLTLAVVASACTSPAGTGPKGEDAANGGKPSTRVVRVAGKTFKILVPGDAPVTLIIGGKPYMVDKAGNVVLPDAVIAEARSKGGFTVIAPGFAPQKVDFDKAGSEIGLQPARKLASGALGSLAADDGSVRLTLPPLGGALGGKAPPASLSSYEAQPTPAAEAEFKRHREAIAGPNAPCDAPWPCAPIVAGLGLLLDVEGPLKPGPMAVEFDLARELLASPGKAAVIDRIRKTWDRLDPAARAALEQRHGVKLDGAVLKFAVTLGDAQAAEGAALIEVEGVALLGALVELTIVSRPPLGADGGLAPSTFTPTAGASRVPTGPLASAIPDFGGGNSLITDNGGGIVSNNGGSILGKVRIPFVPLHARYRLQAYADHPWPGVSMTCMLVDGTDWSPRELTNDLGDYRLPRIESTAPYLIVHGQAPAFGYNVYGLTEPPGQGAEVQCDIDAATTGMTAWVLREIRSGRATLAQVDKAGYLADVAWLRGMLTQDEAEKLMTESVEGQAALVHGVFANARRPRSALPGYGVILSTLTSGQRPTMFAPGPGGGGWAATLGAGNDGRRLTRYGRDGSQEQVELFDPDTSMPQPEGPCDVIELPSGDLLVALRFSREVVKARANGRIEWRAPLEGGPYHMVRIRGDNVLVAVGSGKDRGGQLIRLDGKNVADQKDLPFEPRRIALDSTGAVWVSCRDKGVDRIVKLSRGLEVRFRTGIGAGATSVAVDSKDRAWIVSTEEAKLYKLSPEGEILGTFALASGAEDVAVGPDDTVWVSQVAGTLARFSQTGALLATYPGGQGLGRIAFDEAGIAWVTVLETDQVLRIAP